MQEISDAVCCGSFKGSGLDILEVKELCHVNGILGSTGLGNRGHAATRADKHRPRMVGSGWTGEKLCLSARCRTVLAQV